MEYVSFRNIAYKSVFSKSGFTLAEVLLALTIIGVVASYTIPSLFQNVTDSALLIKYKQAFSDLSAATRTLETNKITIDTSSEDDFRAEYKSVMNVVKEDAVENLQDTALNCYKSDSICSNTPGYPAFLLSNGVTITFISRGSNCSGSWGSLTKVCGDFMIDVNGKSPPNMVGKDYFEAWLIKKNGGYLVVPSGSNNDGFSCVAGSADWWTSSGCSAIPFKNGSMP